MLSNEIGGGIFDNNEIDKDAFQRKMSEILQQLRNEFGSIDQPENDSVEITKQKSNRLNEIVKGDTLLTRQEVNCLLWELRKQVLAPLDALLQWDFDIEVLGADAVFIYAYHRREQFNVSFEDDAHFKRSIDRLLDPLGIKLDSSHPMASAKLEDGSQLEAIIPPLTIDGPILTIKRPRPRTWTFAELIGGTVATTIDGKFFEHARQPW